ncbi:MAG: GNAT family N-acetyltransferase [Myxococcales bacterium]|nr:GNAT family N-acetyltransferase [Myxococcales bacterium]
MKGKKGQLDPRRPARPLPGADREPRPGPATALRRLALDDLALFQRAMNSPGLRAFRGGGEPLGDDVAGLALQGVIDRHGRDQLWYAIVAKASGQAIGCIALVAIDPAAGAAEQVAFVDEAAAGQGVARDALALVLAHAFDVLGLYRVVGVHLAHNERFRPGLERLGYVEAGRLRRYADVDGQRVDLVMMDVTRETFRRPAPPPRKG